MKTLLEVRNLKKYYLNHPSWLSRKKRIVRAVDGIDFSVEAGQVVALVGESGSGKSTAALAAMRLIEPTMGTVHFMGKELSSLSHKELRALRPHFQMVFQNPFTSLNPRKNVLDNMTGALQFHKLVHTEQERIEKGYHLLAQVGLEKNALFLYPHQFSGGQQQRIAIGRALAMNPKLIVCDEAVSALDLSVQAEILNLLYQLKKEMHLSYLFISHDLAVVRAFCDIILVMYRGKIVEQGRREQIFSSPRHPYTQMLLQSRLKSHPKEKKELFVMPIEKEEEISGCPFYSRCPKREEGCKHHLPIVKHDERLQHSYHCIH